MIGVLKEAFKADLTIKQIAVLYSLYISDQRSLSEVSRDMANVYGLRTLPNLSHIVKKLSAGHYITIHASSMDDRRHIIKLTQDGERMVGIFLGLTK